MVTNLLAVTEYPGSNSHILPWCTISSFKKIKMLLCDSFSMCRQLPLLCLVMLNLYDEHPWLD